MISEPRALHNGFGQHFQHAYNRTGGDPANLKQGPALKRGTSQTCTVYLSVTVPGTPPRDSEKALRGLATKR
jgi:hypothetical protein